MSWFPSDEEGKRAEWLKSLNPGDVVAVAYYPNGAAKIAYQKARVKHITPKRTRFDLEGYDTITFNSRGSHYPGGYSSSTSIVPYTDEIREAVVLRNALRRCKDAKWDVLPRDLVLKVNALLREEEKKALDTKPESL